MKGKAMSRYLNNNVSEVKGGLCSGVHKLADIVGTTYGPKGKYVIIDKKFGTPMVTKDGITVAREVFLENPIESMGCEIVKEAANRVGTTAGDGTTTTILLASAILEHAAKSSITLLTLQEELREAEDIACQYITDLSSEITHPQDVENIAMVSSNHDAYIATLIREAYEKTGHATILVTDSKSVETSLDVTLGMELNRGWLAPQFANDPKDMTWKNENVRILIYDGRIASVQPLIPLLQYCSTNAIPLLIVAHDVDGEAYGTILTNVIMGALKACVIKAPLFGEKRDYIMEDLAILTDAMVISEKTATKLEDLSTDGKREAFLGTALSVKVTKDTCTISGGSGKKDVIDLRIEQVTNQINKDWENKDFHEARLARIKGGISEIKVGGRTDTEMLEKKARIEDAVCAAKAALISGCVPGGGTSYFYAGQMLMELPKSKKSEAFKILGLSLQEPLKMLFESADLKPPKKTPLPQDRDLQSVDLRSYNPGYMRAMGIVDPTDVAIGCIRAAVAAAITILSSGGVILPKGTKEDPSDNIQYNRRP